MCSLWSDSHRCSALPVLSWERASRPPPSSWKPERARRPAPRAVTGHHCSRPTRIATPANRTLAKPEGKVMRTKLVAGAVTGALLAATALTPARAADMTNDRALNPQREPQNWILHHGNYQGHRFSLLKEINAETVKNLKPAF